MANIDLLSIGDASIDVFLNPTETQTQCRIDTKECFICFSYGDKIPVRNLVFTSGGNAANNAVGTRRMGISSSIVLTVGDDSVGKQIIEALQKEGVDLTYVSQEPQARSNYSTIVSYSGERTIFVYHAPRNYNFPENLPQTPWVYLTSMGESFKPFYDKIALWVKNNPQTKLVFNPGSWQFKMGMENISEILRLTYLIFVNREEAEKLTGLKKGGYASDRELLAALSKLGPKVSVITDGGNGSIAFDGTQYLKAGVLPVDPYERTGAGDAFGSGTLSALIKGKPLNEALMWGTINSASVIGYTGPQKGLLTESQLPEWIERCKSSGVKVEELV